MNPWLNRWLWTSSVILFLGLCLSKALISIGVGCLFLGAIIFIITEGFPKNYRSFFPLFGLSSFYFFYFISLIFCSNFVKGIEEIFAQHAFVSIPFIVYVLHKWFAPRVHQLLQIFIAGCVIHCFITLFFLVLPESTVSNLVGNWSLLQPYPELTDRLKFGLYTPFIERLNLAYLIGFGILYLLYYGLSKKWTIWNIISLSLLSITFLMIGARGAQLSLLIALFSGGCLLIIQRLKSQSLSKVDFQQKLTAAITVLLLVAIGGPFLAYQTIPAVQKRYAQMQWELRLIKDGSYIHEEYQYFTSLSRIRAWTNAWNIVQSNPIFGVGISDYRDVLTAENKKYQDLVPVHNQNFYLYLWGSSGILALIAWIIGLVVYLKNFYRKKYLLFQLVLTYLIFVSISCLIDAFLIYHIGSHSVILFLSLLFTLNLKERVKDS